MKKINLKIALLIVAAIFGYQAANAQITITLPKMPKIKKPKIVQTQTTETTDATNETNQSGQNTASETSATSTESKPQDDEPMDARLGLFIDEIAKAQKEVDGYTPLDKMYFVGSTSTDWLWRAVSPKERNEFIEKWKPLMNPATRKRFDDSLDALNASAAKKLPEYKSSLRLYTARNAAEERLMRGVLTNVADYKIFSVGLKEANWLIDKNDLGIPTARYKHGVIYLRNTKSDHPYCYATYVNIKQDYAGGGTYGASYARFIEDEMVGCPAGAK